jgi:hypothetical protein
MISSNDDSGDGSGMDEDNSTAKSQEYCSHQTVNLCNRTSEYKIKKHLAYILHQLPKDTRD